MVPPEIHCKVHQARLDHLVRLEKKEKKESLDVLVCLDLKDTKVYPEESAPCACQVLRVNLAFQV